MASIIYILGSAGGCHGGPCDDTCTLHMIGIMINVKDANNAMWAHSINIESQRNLEGHKTMPHQALHTNTPALNHRLTCTVCAVSSANDQNEDSQVLF